MKLLHGSMEKRITMVQEALTVREWRGGLPGEQRQQGRGRTRVCLGTEYSTVTT